MQPISRSGFTFLLELTIDSTFQNQSVFFWWNERTSRKKWKRAKTQEMQRTTIVYCQRALRRNKCRGSYGRNLLNMSKLSLESKNPHFYMFVILKSQSFVHFRGSARVFEGLWDHPFGKRPVAATAISITSTSEVDARDGGDCDTAIDLTWIWRMVLNFGDSPFSETHL